jgi:hypothetical protein
MVSREECEDKRKTNTGATVLDRLVRNRKFPEVVTDHLWFNFDRVEDLGKATT